MNLYKKYTGKPYSFLAVDATLASDNPSPFRENLLERIWKLIMTINDKIRDEKLQYDIYKEAAKVSVLSSAKNDKYDHLKGEEILSSNQRQIVKQTKFTCSWLGTPFGKKQRKMTEDQEKKIKALQNRVEEKFLDINQKTIACLFPKDF